MVKEMNNIDKIILVIRKNIHLYSNHFKNLPQELYKIENMQTAKIPERYILKNLIENNSVIIRIIRNLNDGKIVEEIKNELKKIEEN